MGGPRPASLRRSDLLVAVLRATWLLGGFGVAVFDCLTGVIPLALLPSVVAGFVLTLAIELPFLVGMAKGRRWGYVGLALFAAFGVVGALTILPLRGKPLTTLSVATAGIDATLLVYCLFRLRQERIDGVSVPRTAPQKFGDALIGALGASWFIAVTILVAPSLARSPIRPFDAAMLANFGLLGAGYLAVCWGVGLGRRWSFVAMIVMSVFILIVLRPSLVSLHPPLPHEIAVATFSGAAIVYCVVRLRRPPNSEMAVKNPLLP